MIDHCNISEYWSSVMVKQTILTIQLVGISFPVLLEVLMRPIPFPILLADRQPHVVRAHRMRSAVVAGLFRDFVRWVSVAAR
jgi:hypothetical protein